MKAVLAGVLAAATLAGSTVTHVARQRRYDGAKAGDVILEIVARDRSRQPSNLRVAGGAASGYPGTSQKEPGMNFRLAVLAGFASATLAGQAWADPEVLVKCDSARPTGQRFTNTAGWQPYAPTDRAVTITRDKGKLTIEVAGEAPYTSHLVFAIPQTHTEKFRVMGQDGAQNFYLVTGANSGKTELKHSIFGGKDGSHAFNIRVTTLDNCTVVSPDVAVTPEVPGAAPKR